jgi:hypothetical protein
MLQINFFADKFIIANFKIITLLLSYSQETAFMYIYVAVLFRLVFVGSSIVGKATITSLLCYITRYLLQ